MLGITRYFMLTRTFGYYLMFRVFPDMTVNFRYNTTTVLGSVVALKNTLNKWKRITSIIGSLPRKKEMISYMPRYTQEYPEISKSKYPIDYFNTLTRLQPDLLPAIFSNTRPDPTLKHPTCWALKIVNKQTKDFFHRRISEEGKSKTTAVGNQNVSV